MCIFCDKYQNNEGVVYQNNSVFVIYDSFPVSKGHCLIITKRHIKTYFDANEEELKDINLAIKEMKNIIDHTYKPDGYNIGVNCSEAAGQSIMHLHVHLIPRYKFDCENPKGGIRGVIPEKQNY